MLYPTLIIALGGTGSNVLENLRRRLFLTYGSYSPENRVAYLVIDTDESNDMTRWKEGIRLSVSNDIITQLGNPESTLAKKLNLKNWLDPDLEQGLTTDKFAQGVGGVRMLGRLAFLASPQVATIFTRLSDTLNLLHSQRPDNQPASVKILVVASAGGGTGSGCFLDMGYLIRQTVARMTPPIPYQMEGIAAIAVPDMHHNDPKKPRNSAALLHELDHFCQELHTFEAQYPFGALSAEIGRNAPYPYITLVSPTHDHQKLNTDVRQAMTQLEGKIADYLYLRMTDPTGRNGLDARLRDLGEVWNIVGKDNKGYPNRYMTFGVSLRQYPSGLLNRIAECQAYEQFVAGWLKEKLENTYRLQTKLIEQGGALYDAFYKDFEEMKGWLGMKQKFDKSPRPANNSNLLYTRLIASPQQSLEMKLQAAVAQQNVDEQFQYQGERHNLIPDSKGFIVGVITENKNKLVNRSHPDSTLAHLLQRFWERTFMQGFGPRYALTLLESLSQALTEEIKFIQEVITQHSSDGATLSAAARANRKFEDCLIGQTKEVYEETLKALSTDERSVRRRLELVIAFVEAWKSERLRDAAQATALLAKLAPGEFAEEARRRAGTLLFDLNMGDEIFRELETQTRSEKFGPGLPKSATGENNYDTFGPIEAKIKERLNEDLPESALGLIAETNQGNLQPDCDRLAEESRPLLSLHLDAEGYGELQFGAFQDRITRWLASAYQGTDVPLFNAFSEGLTGGIKPQRVAADIGATSTEVMDSEEPSVVSMVFQRVAFPSRIISGYDYEDRMLLLNPPGATLTTPFTQSGIAPQVDPKHLEKVQQVLLIAEALRSKPARVLSGPNIEHAEEHIYSYTPPTRNLPDTLTYPREFDRAVQRVASQRYAFNAMKAEIGKLTSDADVRGEVKAVMKTHRDAIKALRAENPTQKYGYYDEFDFENMDYQLALDAITDWLVENDLEPKGDHPWAKLNDEKVWICGNSSCKRPQGKERPSNTDGCKYCKWGKI